MKKGLKFALGLLLVGGWAVAGISAETVKLTYMYWGSPAEDEAT